MALGGALLVFAVAVTLLGLLAWLVWRCLQASASRRQLSEEQRRAVAQSFMRGAQLMGRRKGAKQPLTLDDAALVLDQAEDSGSSSRGSFSKGQGAAAAVATRPSRDALREAVQAFDEGLQIHPDDFSTRFLRAQALEELGELSEALAELDWLVLHKSTVKPPFLMRMAIAAGWAKGPSVAPQGLRLVGELQSDLVLFHLRKRRGRVLLRKARVPEALRELTTAKGMLDTMLWDEKLTARTSQVRARMRSMRQVGPEGTAGVRSQRQQAEPGPTEAPGIGPALGSSASGRSAATTLQPPTAKDPAGKAFSPTEAQAELNVLLARCHEIQGKYVLASKCLHEAVVLGNEKTKEEARLALQKLEDTRDRGKVD